MKILLIFLLDLLDPSDSSGMTDGEPLLHLLETITNEILY